MGNPCQNDSSCIHKKYFKKLNRKFNSLAKLANCQYNKQIDNKIKFTFAGIMHVGRKIRLLRISKGFTQQQLAEKIHKERPLISHIERTGKVNHDTLLSICKVFKTTPELLNSVADEPFPNYAPRNTEELQLANAENERLTNELKLKDEMLVMKDEMLLLLKSQIKELKMKSKK